MRKLALLGGLALAPTAVASAAVRMNGYGATRKAWAAHHERDPNPKLVKGCCYLPRQAGETDRYYAVFRDGGRVYGYSMHFAPRVSASVAQLLLRQDELPAGARRVRRERRAECLILQYRSAAAKRALGGATFGVALYSSETGRYTGQVKDIIIMLGITTSAGCWDPK